LDVILAAVLANEAQRARRGKSAYEFAQQYSWQRTAAELATLYRQIA
jgi:glycosyltransferase involved in cell wall biosynthesis